MKSAFRNLPIRSQDWRWIILKAEHLRTGQTWFFANKCVPFGSSFSCSHFQRVSDGIEAILKYKTGRESNNYLDDFLLIALLQATCDDVMNQFLMICGKINFPIAEDKTVWSTTCITFLGMIIDTIKQIIEFPKEKKDKAAAMLNKMVESKKTTILQIQQLAWLLNHLCEAIFPARAFTHRFYAKTKNCNLNHTITCVLMLK